MSTAHRYSSRGEWLRARRIGSSDVAALLGLSRYATGFDVWDRLVNGVVEVDATPDQERGIRLEPRVLATYTQRTGRPVERTPPHTLYAREDWSTSTPDGITPEGVLVEAKTDRRAERWGPEGVITRWEPGAEQIVRPDYYLQVQHQLWTLDRKIGDLAVLVPGEDPFLPELRVYRLHRDDEVVELMVERCREFWRSHVVTREPPPLDDSSAALRALARVEREGSRRATADEERLAAAYVAAAEAEKRAKDEKRRISRELVAAAGRARYLDLAAGRVTIVAGQSSAQLDEPALREEHPELVELLERYRRPGAPFTYPRVTATPTRRQS